MLLIGGGAIIAHLLGMSPLKGAVGLLKEFRKLISLAKDLQSLNALIFIVLALILVMYFFSTKFANVLLSISGETPSSDPSFIEFLVSVVCLALFGGWCVRTLNPD